MLNEITQGEGECDDTADGEGEVPVFMLSQKMRGPNRVFPQSRPV